MNEGVISKRYAKAILEFAIEQKNETFVYDEMKKLTELFNQHKSLVEAMDNPILSKEEKGDIIYAMLDNKPSEDFMRIVSLLSQNDRFNYIRMIALSYISAYRDFKHLNSVKLVTADQPDESTVEHLRLLAERIKPGEMDFEIKVDPTVEGGFIMFIDTYRLDASVKTQLSNIRKQLIIENSRV